MSIYTPKMREEIRKYKPPHDFVIDIIEYDLNPKFLAIRFYESQWKRYNDAERLKCILYLDTIKTLLESYGVMVTLEPVSDLLENKDKR